MCFILQWATGFVHVATAGSTKERADFKASWRPRPDYLSFASATVCWPKQVIAWARSKGKRNRLHLVMQRTVKTHTYRERNDGGHFCKHFTH